MKYSLTSIFLYLLTCFPAFLMMGLAYGATAESLMAQEPAYATFVRVGGYTVPIVLLVAIVLTIVAKKKKESAYIAAFIIGLFVLGFNLLACLFWSRLFFDLIIGS